MDEDTKQLIDVGDRMVSESEPREGVVLPREPPVSFDLIDLASPVGGGGYNFPANRPPVPSHAMPLDLLTADTPPEAPRRTRSMGADAWTAVRESSLDASSTPPRSPSSTTSSTSRCGDVISPSELLDLIKTFWRRIAEPAAFPAGAASVGAPMPSTWYCVMARPPRTRSVPPPPKRPRRRPAARAPRSAPQQPRRTRRNAVTSSGDLTPVEITPEESTRESPIDGSSIVESPADGSSVPESSVSLTFDGGSDFASGDLPVLDSSPESSSAEYETPIRRFPKDGAVAVEPAASSDTSPDVELPLPPFFGDEAPTGLTTPPAPRSSPVTPINHRWSFGAR